MKKILFICFGVLMSICLSAKDKAVEHVVIQNATVTRNSTVFHITYDIAMGENVQSCKVRLLISLDDGDSFYPVDNKYLTGDIGKILGSGPKEIAYDFSSDKETLAGKPLSFKVDVAGMDVIKLGTAINGQVAVYPHLSYGLMFGMVKRIGWYAKVRTDFSFPKYSYSVNVLDGLFWGTGEKKISRFCATGGLLTRAAKWMYPYVGAGWGRYGLFLHDLSDEWAKAEDYSANGVTIDAGLLFKIGPVCLNAGICNTAFKYTEAEVGIGLMF